MIGMNKDTDTTKKSGSDATETKKHVEGIAPILPIEKKNETLAGAQK